MYNLIDLTGQRFGRLTVLYKAKNKGSRTYWHCLCDCGKEKDILAICLSNGHTKSCGCLRSESSFIKNYVGEKFGLLTVIERLDHYKNNKTYYKCDCECGGTRIISGSNLVSKSNKGIILSCGCLMKNKKYLSNRIQKGRKENKYVVYKHIFPNEKYYIGITKNNVEDRWKSGTGYNNQILMKRAIEKYGWDNIRHEIVEEGLTYKEACDKEQYYIDLFKTTNRQYGYNVTSGGDCGTCIVNPVIQYYKMSVVNKFENLTVASKFLGISGTAIKSYSNENKNIAGYSFDVLPAIYSYDVSKDFYTTRNNEHFNIKSVIQKEVTKSTLLRNKNMAKRINQYSLEGRYIKTWNSIKEAKNNVPNTQGLTACLSEKYSKSKSAGGYLWKYDNGDYNDIEPYHANGRSVVQVNKDTNKIINVFTSMKEAERVTSINSKQICKVCKHLRKTAGGYIWQYADGFYEKASK